MAFYDIAELGQFSTKLVGPLNFAPQPSPWVQLVAANRFRVALIIDCIELLGVPSWYINPGRAGGFLPTSGSPVGLIRSTGPHIMEWHYPVNGPFTSCAWFINEDVGSTQCYFAVTELIMPPNDCPDVELGYIKTGNPYPQKVSDTDNGLNAENQSAIVYPSISQIIQGITQ